MTPTRAKRNSKAPERFSSDDVKTDPTNGSSNQSHGDKSNSVTKIKLKAIIREPLKVKLPKLRRPMALQSHSHVKDSTGINYGGSFAKIKLPPKRTIERNGNQNQSLGLMKSLHDPPTATKRSSDDKSKFTTYKSSDLISTSPSINDVRQEDESARKSEYLLKELEIGSDEVDASSEAGSPSRSVKRTNVEKKSESSSNSGIRCPCGVDDDLGVMVECEKCSNWQHGHCINVGLEEDAYEGYVCAYCLLPPGKHNDSLQQLAINDKFQSKFEALETFMKLRSGTQNGCKDELNIEDPIDFAYEELETATSDLRRVSNSLEVKWKLLTSDDYNAELKIWKNPIWSDDPNENRKQQQQTVRFIYDIYKSNLKLNICNMLNQMHKRCQLIRYQISRIGESQQESQSKFDKLLVTLDRVASLVEQVSDDLRTGIN